MPGASAIPHSRCVTLSAQFAAKNSPTVENDREKWHTFLRSRPRRDHRGVDLISDALPFGRLWYGEPNAITNAIYAKFSAAHMML